MLFQLRIQAVLTIKKTLLDEEVSTADIKTEVVYPRVEMKVPCMPNSPKSFIKACSRRETYVYVQSCTRMCPVYPVIDVPWLSFEIYVNIIDLIYIYVATKENAFTEICVSLVGPDQFFRVGWMFPTPCSQVLVYTCRG